LGVIPVSFGLLAGRQRRSFHEIHLFPFKFKASEFIVRPFFFLYLFQNNQIYL